MLPVADPPVSVEERRHKELLYALASLSGRIDALTQRPLPEVVVGAPDMGPVHEAMRVLAERGDVPLHEPVAFPDMEALLDRFAAALPPDRSFLVAEALEQVKEALTRLSKKVGALGIMPSGGASGHVLVDNAATTPANVHDAKLDGTIDTTGSVTIAELTETNSRIGAVTEAAPGTDTASSGLNGRLQRVSQRLTSLIALFPTSIGQKTKAGSLSVTLASDTDGITVSAADTRSRAERVLKAAPSAGEEVRLDATATDDYTGMATDGADTTTAVWDVTRAYKTGVNVTRIRFRSGIKWAERTLGW